MDQMIRNAFNRTTHNPEWLDRYLNFLEGSVDPSDDEYSESHHILPVSLYPEFKRASEHPWNQITLRGSDHLIAHYFLLRALPELLPLRHAFCFMAGMRLESLDPEQISPQLLGEMADHYTFQKTGLKWVVRDGEERKILPHEFDAYLADGWVLGRAQRHTELHKQRLVEWSKRYHATETQKTDAYSHLPHGDQHHRRTLGCPPEVRAKISAALMGHTQAPESIEKRRRKMIGKRWQWTPESRLTQSERQTGEGNNRFGRVGYWRGKTRPESFGKFMSDRMNLLYQTNPDHPTFANRPRGEDHWTYGKERTEQTKQRISEALTGRKPTAETKQKRADSLAMSKLPQFPPEHEELFHQIVAATTPEERERLRLTLPVMKERAAAALAFGLCIILNGQQEQKKRRYWRTAETWLKKNSIKI